MSERERESILCGGDSRSVVIVLHVSVDTAILVCVVNQSSMVVIVLGSGVP